MQEQLEDVEREKARILTRAIEECLKRTRIAHELLGLNVLLLDQKFMAETLDVGICEDMQEARIRLAQAMKTLGEAKG